MINKLKKERDTNLKKIKRKKLFECKYMGLLFAFIYKWRNKPIKL